VQVYDFQVQAANSHWKLEVGPQSVVTAYTGSIRLHMGRSQYRARPAHRVPGPQHSVRFSDRYARVRDRLFVRDD
jgi:hypothetical protein